MIKWLMKFFGWDEEEEVEGVMIEVDDPHAGLRADPLDCCGTCLHWSCAHPEAWGWGTSEEPDGLGKCWVHGVHKYGGDWCEEFKEKVEADGG